MKPRHRQRFLSSLLLGAAMFALLVAPAAADSQQVNIYPGWGDYYTTHSHHSAALQACGAEWYNQDDDFIYETSTSSVTFSSFGITAYSETGPVYGGQYWVLDSTNPNNDHEWLNINDVRLNNNQNYTFSTGWTVGSRTSYYPVSYVDLWSGAYGSGILYCKPYDQVAYVPH